MPKNRLAEDGRIPDRYPNLTETDTEDSGERTKLNVLESDGTLIFSHGPLSGGSELTRTFALEVGKPVQFVDFSEQPLRLPESINTVRSWLANIDCKVLNIAGPRESEDAQIYASVYAFLLDLFG